MDVATAAVGRPHARPTQAYYVPRRLLQCGLPTANGLPEDKERCVDGNEVLRESAPQRLKKEQTERKTEKNSERSERNERNERSEKQRKTVRTPPPKSPEIKADVRPPKQQVAKPSLSPRANQHRNGNRSPTSQREVGQPPFPFEKRTDEVERTRDATAREQGAVMLTTQNNKAKAAANARTRPPVYNPEAPVLLRPETEGECICERAAAHVYCKRCSYECSGRVQRVCPEHPTRMALMDLRECPNQLCRSVQLLELSN